MSVSSQVSVEEYLAAEWPPNSQLIDGEVIVNDPAWRHQRVVGGIYIELAVWLDAVPDLAVEVRSPTTGSYDTGAKRRAYETAGLPELWLVDPATQHITVLRRSHPDTPTFDRSITWTAASTATGDQLPGWQVPVATFFES